MGAQNQRKNMFKQLFRGVRAFSIKIAAMLAAILDFSESAMIQANHPRFSYTLDMSLTIYGTIFSGPLMFTEPPSGTVLLLFFLRRIKCLQLAYSPAFIRFSLSDG